MGIFSALTGLVSGKNKDDDEHAAASKKLQDFLQNQIDTLDREELSVHINEITVGYVFYLIMLITKKRVSLGDVRHAMRDIFSDKMSLIMIDNAIGIFDGDAQTEEKLAAISPIAKQEYETGSGEFLIRHTRKAQKGIDAMFSDEDFDPREVSRWNAGDLA